MVIAELNLARGKEVSLLAAVALIILPAIAMGAMAIGAIATGHIARGQIRRRRGTGSRQATIGLLLGYAFLLWFVTTSLMASIGLLADVATGWPLALVAAIVVFAFVTAIFISAGYLLHLLQVASLRRATASAPRVTAPQLGSGLALVSLYSGIAPYPLVIILARSVLPHFVEGSGLILEIGLLVAVVTALGAIATGHIARGQIRRSQGTGLRQATTGVVLGYSFLLLVIFGILILLSIRPPFGY
jgi:hypothetical protein